MEMKEDVRSALIGVLQELIDDMSKREFSEGEGDDEMVNTGSPIKKMKVVVAKKGSADDAPDWIKDLMK